MSPAKLINAMHGKVHALHALPEVCQVAQPASSRMSCPAHMLQSCSLMEFQMAKTCSKPLVGGRCQ